MKNEFYNLSEIIIAVLDGANDVATYFSGNHELGHYQEGDNGQEWCRDGWTDEEWDLMQSVIKGIMAGQFRLRLSKKQETNLRNIVRWLQEDNVEIRLPVA